MEQSYLFIISYPIVYLFYIGYFFDGVCSSVNYYNIGPDYKVLL